MKTSPKPGTNAPAFLPYVPAIRCSIVHFQRVRPALLLILPPGAFFFSYSSSA